MFGTFEAVGHRYDPGLNMVIPILRWSQTPQQAWREAASKVLAMTRRQEIDHQLATRPWMAG